MSYILSFFIGLGVFAAIIAALLGLAMLVLHLWGPAGLILLPLIGIAILLIIVCTLGGELIRGI